MTHQSAAFVVHEASVITRGEDHVCEDGLVITSAFVAVVDGATTPHALGTDGRTTGKIAMDAVTEVIKNLAPNDSVETFLDRAAASIVAHATLAGLAPELPTAAAVVYSSARNEVWGVGDARWSVEGVPPAKDPRAIDRLAVRARALILRAAHLYGGATVEELRANDIGGASSNVIREVQLTSRNIPASGGSAFAALTGTPVLRELVEVIPVPPGARVVLASDGYLDAAPTLADAELELATALAADPLHTKMILASTCPTAADTPFDDRTYVSFTART